MEIPENVLNYLVIPAIKAFVIINIMAVMAGVLTLVERRVPARLPIPKGPERVGFAVVSVVRMSRSLSLVGIVEAQRDRGLWFIFPGLVAFFLYFLSGVAETNHVPFDLPEAESELVAGFHTEYSGVKWSFFFLAEYANMVTVSAIATTLFFGGWLRPFPNVAALSFLDAIPGIAWFLLKIF